MWYLQVISVRMWGFELRCLIHAPACVRQAPPATMVVNVLHPMRMQARKAADDSGGSGQWTRFVFNNVRYPSHTMHLASPTVYFLVLTGGTLPPAILPRRVSCAQAQPTARLSGSSTASLCWDRERHPCLIVAVLLPTHVRACEGRAACVCCAQRAAGQGERAPTWRPGGRSHCH